MQKILLLTIALFCAYSQTAHAQSSMRYESGETIYVWARTGLVLRKTADFNGTKITTLPYGTKVECIVYDQIKTYSNELAGDYDAPEEHQLTIFKATDVEPFVLRGCWVKVKVDGKEGYLFDIYLSRLAPASVLEPAQTIEEGMDQLAAYAKTNWSMVQENPIMMFSNGSVYWKHQRWVLPDMNETEVFLLTNYFFTLQKRSSDAKDKEKFTYTSGYNWRAGDFLSFDFVRQVGPKDEDEEMLFHFIIKQTGAIWIIYLDAEDQGGC
jgi:hypothetical protein